MNEPVVVVGAGPVGQTAALLLARWGLPVVVLERRHAREAVGSKSICQQRDVLDVWASVGCEAIAREGLTWTTARTYHRDRELFSWSFVDEGHLPPFVNISQTRTEELLDEEIAKSSAIRVRWGHEVVGLEQDDDGVTVMTRTGGPVRAGHVVLCAGGRADGLRRGLGVAFPGETYDDEFLICDIRADLPRWASERRFYFDPPWNPGRQVLIHPCPGGTFRIDWQVPPGYDPAADDLDARIRQVIGAAPYELLWHSVYRFQSRVADRLRAGRVLLAGDAAHLFAPFGARGLNSGVADAENAAWKIAFVRRGLAGEGLLESYHAERHAAALENLEITAATMRFLVPRTDEEIARRHTILEGAAEDPSQVDSGRLAEPYWYVGSPLTTPEPSRPFEGRPPKGAMPPPAPGVLMPLRDARLRKVARTGFTLLRGPGCPPDLAREPVTVLDGVEGPAPGEAWLLRPDAHIAAILPGATAETVARALRTALGGP
ncbi:FAD-dependent monooxygenase [Nonomuraea sp. NPDC050663]|uniref:FAD-dependent monooxygenase n=1 Tax=Nonomuraea sp. NPDC050663 TaxID=3364370 RepID=UPI0037BA42B5